MNTQPCRIWADIWTLPRGLDEINQSVVFSFGCNETLPQELLP